MNPKIKAQLDALKLDKPKKKRSESGTRADLGFYVRSKWEANYARYLNWLQAQGQIYKWEYEVDEFWFEGIKRGTKSYKPDFKVWTSPTTFEYHEVKGYMDATSLTKLKRMAKYHPQHKVVVIDAEAFKELNKWSRLIPNWE